MFLLKYDVVSRKLITLGISFAIISCQTLSSKNEESPPEISNNMEIGALLNAGIRFGGPVLEKVKSRLVREHRHGESSKWMTEWFRKKENLVNEKELANATHLYLASSSTLDLGILKSLLSSEKPSLAGLGWYLAAARPDPRVAEVLDNELTVRITRDEEDAILVPQMAHAVRENNLRSSYSLVKRGLLENGDEAFAKAMIALGPRKASADFLDYLAGADAEELRQMTQVSVNFYTCLVIFRHLLSYPAPINHPHFNHLFLYAVSRNQALAGLARSVLELRMGQNREQLALELSRQPSWVQLAYVEAARDDLGPKTKLFLGSLQKATPYTDVVHEISELR